MDIKFLQDHCSKYCKLAFEHLPATSLVENRDPILKQLSELKSFEDRVKLAEEHFKKLGEGSARTVFKISDELILKVAHNEKGQSQNLTEAKLDLQMPCAVSILAHDPDGKWLIADFSENITKEDFKHYIGVSFDQFMDSLFYAYNNESDAFKKPRDYDQVKQLPLFKCLGQMIVAENLLIGDLDKTSSWGLKNGRIVLRDAGLNKDNYIEYYQSKSTSTSSSPKTSS